jgi:hypothetical protein
MTLNEYQEIRLLVESKLDEIETLEIKIKQLKSDIGAIRSNCKHKFEQQPCSDPYEDLYVCKYCGLWK